MKNRKILLLFTLLLTLLNSCQQDSFMEDLEFDNGIQNSEIQLRSYDEDACGEVSELCLKCQIVANDGWEVARTTGFDRQSLETNEGIDNNYLEIVIEGETYGIRPANYFGGETQEYLISTPTGSYITSNIQNDYVRSKALEIELPDVLQNVYKLDHKQFMDGNLNMNHVRRAFGMNTQLANRDDEGFTISTTGLDASSGCCIVVYDPCNGINMSALVLKYKEVLGMNDPHTNAEEIIEDAININTPSGFNPKTDCLNTQDIVENILNDPLIAGSSFAQFLIKLNYLDALLELDNITYQSLIPFSNASLVDEVYNSLSLNIPTPTCQNADCSKKAAINAYIKSTLLGEIVNLSDLINFSAELYCDDIQAYNLLYEGIEELYYVVGGNCSGSADFLDCITNEYINYANSNQRRVMCVSSILIEDLNDPDVDAWYFQMLQANYMFAYQDPTNPSFSRIFNVGFGPKFCIQVYDGIITNPVLAKIAFANAFEAAIDQTEAELNATPWDDILLNTSPMLVNSYIFNLFKANFSLNLQILFGGLPSMNSLGCPGVQGFVPNYRPVPTPEDC